MAKIKSISKAHFATKYKELSTIARQIRDESKVTSNNAKIIQGLLTQFSKLHDEISTYSLTPEQESKLRAARELAPKPMRRELKDRLHALKAVSDKADKVIQSQPLEKSLDDLMEKLRTAAKLSIDSTPITHKALLNAYKAQRDQVQKIIDKMDSRLRAPFIKEMLKLSQQVNEAQLKIDNLIKEYAEKTTAPFIKSLSIKHTVPRDTSYSPNQLRSHTDSGLRELAPDFDELQLLALADNIPAYELKLAAIKSALPPGCGIRLTKGNIFLTRREKLTVDVEIKVQVKGHSLTWYFWAPGAMDQYDQSFRDELYDQAKVCHRNVDAGCELYYRGSNSVHIKLMHTVETESNHNHNHYRLRDNKSYTPIDFKQHMQGFKDWELARKYFKPGEIEEICMEFEAHYLEWTRKAEGDQSKEERYFSSPDQKLNTGDMIELYLFGTMQEPCRLSAMEIKVDYDRAREAINSRLKSELTGKGRADLREELIHVKRQYEALLEYRAKSGSRGLNSSIASARQVEHSANAVVRAQQVMDDSLGLDSTIPQWAEDIKHSMAESQSEFMRLVSQRHVDRTPPKPDDMALVWARRAGKSFHDLYDSGNTREELPATESSHSEATSEAPAEQDEVESKDDEAADTKRISRI